MKDGLENLIREDLDRRVSDAVRRFAEELAGKSKSPPVAVLFYGAAVRTGDLGGVLDFYVIVDSLSDWHPGRIRRMANRLLPPNVEYHETTIGGDRLRAKVAILSRGQFHHLVQRRSLDTSVWSRFCQPVAVPFVRDGESGERIGEALACAVTTAAVWAARLGPEEGDALTFWRALFRRTYASELRVETSGRADTIVDYAPLHYCDSFEPALRAGGIPVEQCADGMLKPVIATGARRAARHAWAGRRLLAKPLNIARLAKAAFTFEGGVDYIAWKIARHTDVEIALTPWQRRHPLLAAGPILWRLWRRGVLK